MLVYAKCHPNYFPCINSFNSPTTLEVETIIILISWMKSWAHIDHTARRHSSEKSNFRNYSLDHFVVAPISFQHMLPFFI